MLATLAVGVPLLVLAWAVGAQLPAPAGLRVGDRALLAFWCGLLLLAQLLLALSLVAPLGGGIGVAAMALLAMAALARGTVRERVVELHRALGPRGWCAGASLAVGLALCAGASPVAGGDHALYHYPLMRWLAEHGAVPGLGLLHHRFATAASWWSIDAALDQGALRGHVAPLLGYVTILATAGHALVLAARAARGALTRPDRFLALAYLALAPYLLGYVDEAPFSARADSGVALLAVLVTWGFAALPARERASAPLLGVLAAGAVGLKTSAVPILAVTLLFLARNASLRALLVPAAVLLPTIGFSFASSGCALFPVSATCLDVPWGLGADGASSFSALVTSWARWREIEAPAGFGAWLVAWPGRAPMLAGACAAVLLVGAPALFLRRRGLAHPTSLAWPALLAVTGTAFGVVLAPTLRFFVGYLSLALALGGLVALERRPERSHPGRTAAAPAVIAASTLALLLAAALPTTMLNLRSLIAGPRDQALRFADVRWRAADAVQRPALVEERVSHDVRYVVPVGSLECGAEPLICTPHLDRPVRFRHPERGAAGGFVRAAPHDP